MACSLESGDRKFFVEKNFRFKHVVVDFGVYKDSKSTKGDNKQREYFRALGFH